MAQDPTKPEENLEETMLQRALRSLQDFGGAAKESATDLATGMTQMFKASQGDPLAANQIGEGFLETGKAIKNAPHPHMRSAILAEQLLGIPLQQAGQEIVEGNVAKGLGHATPGALMFAGGAKLGSMGRPKVKAPASVPKLDSRISSLAPERPPLPLEEVLKARAMGADVEGGVASPVKPVVRKDPFGLEPTMDRRGFLKRISGKNMHDANRAIEELDTPAGIQSIEDVYPPEAIKTVLGNDYGSYKAEKNLFNDLIDKYWSIDGSYLSPYNNTGQTIKGFGQALSDNFKNEIKQGLTNEGARIFQEGLDNAGEGSRQLVDSLLNRIKRPRDPRASGMVPGEDPALRNPERILPKQRSKSGMMLDVLDEMGPEGREKFADNMQELSPRVPPSLDPEGLASPMVHIADDPAKYIGAMRSADESAAEANIRGPFRHNPLTINQPAGPLLTDMLLQDMADYFATDKFDPFPDDMRPLGTTILDKGPIDPNIKNVTPRKIIIPIAERPSIAKAAMKHPDFDNYLEVNGLNRAIVNSWPNKQWEDLGQAFKGWLRQSGEFNPRNDTKPTYRDSTPQPLPEIPMDPADLMAKLTNLMREMQDLPNHARFGEYLQDLSMDNDYFAGLPGKDKAYVIHMFKQWLKDNSE